MNGFDFDPGGLTEFSTSGLFDPGGLSELLPFFDFSGGTDVMGDTAGGMFNMDPTQWSFFDTVTGQVVSGTEAMQIDPDAVMAALQGMGTAQPGATTFPQTSLDDIARQIEASVANQPAGGGGLSGWWGTLPTAGKVGLGLGAATAGVGLIGVIQKAFQGDQTAIQEVKRAMAAASPEEQQLIQTALGGLQQLQMASFGPNIMGALEGRAPVEEQMFRQGVGRLGETAGQADQMMARLLPNLGLGAANTLGSQEQVLNLLTQMAQGNIPPQLAQLVEQSFQPLLGNLGTQTIEQARQRGFAGGAELLTQAPGSALLGPMLSDVQGQMAQAKLNLLPMLANVAGAYSTPAALRLSGMQNLLGLNQQIAGAQAGIGQQGMANRLNFLDVATRPLTAATSLLGMAQQPRIAGAGQTATTTTPYSLLDAFAPLASILGGVGGLMGGIGAMQPRQNIFLAGLNPSLSGSVA